MTIDYTAGFYSAASGSHIGSDPAQYVMQYANGQASGPAPGGTAGPDIVYADAHAHPAAFGSGTYPGVFRLALRLSHALSRTRLRYVVGVVPINRSHLGITSSKA